MIPIYTPRVYTDSVNQALQSGWISSQGEYLDKTIHKLKEIFNIPYIVLMNNGTSATHMLSKALKYKYPNLKKLYVPNNVFIAVWNSALYEYPKHMIEILEMSPTTLNMRTDEEYLMSLEKDSAVFIVHNIGNIVNVPRLKRIRPDIVFVEDNCEGLFGKYEEIYSGMSESSLCSAASFFANKTITCGEGGAFFTHDKDVYNFIYKTIHHGITPIRYIYDTLGYNYRMTNIQAALLYDQLINLDKIRNDKHTLFNQYTQLLKDKVILPIVEKDTVSSEWMFVCGMKMIEYTEFETYMKQNKIDIRPFFYDISVHEHLKDIPRIPIDTQVSYFMLPSYPDLKEEEVKSICEAVLRFEMK
jgi:perosamine synthetase